MKSIDAGVFFSSEAGNLDTAAHLYADVEMLTNGSDQPDPTKLVSRLDHRGHRPEVEPVAVEQLRALVER